MTDDTAKYIEWAKIILCVTNTLFWLQKLKVLTYVLRTKERKNNNYRKIKRDIIIYKSEGKNAILLSNLF